MAERGRPVKMSSARAAVVAVQHVAEVQQAAGRLPEAADTLRRGLELEEDQERGRRQRQMLREIRLSAGDRAAEQLLARALRLREDPSDDTESYRLRSGPLPGVGLPSLPEVEARLQAPEPELEAEVPGVFVEEPTHGQSERVWVGEEEAEVVEPVAEVVEPVAAVAVAEATPEAQPPVEEAAAVDEAEPVTSLSAEASPEPEPVVEREVVGVMAALDEVAFPGTIAAVDGSGSSADEMMVQAEGAEAAGDEEELAKLLIRIARAYAREGRFEAGLDAAHRLLRHAPSDVDAHLVLVELYLARHWDALAAEKLMLLNRIAELNDDTATRERLCAVASRAFPSDPRLESLCL